MTLNRLFAASAVALLGLTAPAFAEGIMVKDAYVRSSTPSSPTGAAFLVLMNHTDADDRLIAASSDVAKRVELHTHTENAEGVMKMHEIERGIAVPAGADHVLERGGDHIMFMGLHDPLEQGSEISVTLTFENAGDVTVMIPVDHTRRAAHGAMNHGEMKHGDDKDGD